MPGVAQGAIQMGRHVAKTIRSDLLGQLGFPFRYVDKGDLATIGRAAAVARLGRVHVAGLVAWLIKVGVHIFHLISFPNSNRLNVMI